MKFNILKLLGVFVTGGMANEPSQVNQEPKISEAVEHVSTKQSNRYSINRHGSEILRESQKKFRSEQIADLYATSKPSIPAKQLFVEIKPKELKKPENGEQIRAFIENLKKEAELDTLNREILEAKKQITSKDNELKIAHAQIAASAFTIEELRKTLDNINKRNEELNNKIHQLNLASKANKSIATVSNNNRFSKFNHIRKRLFDHQAQVPKLEYNNDSDELYTSEEKKETRVILFDDKNSLEGHLPSQPKHFDNQPSNIFYIPLTHNGICFNSLTEFFGDEYNKRTFLSIISSSQVTIDLSYLTPELAQIVNSYIEKTNKFKIVGLPNAQLPDSDILNLETGEYEITPPNSPLKPNLKGYPDCDLSAGEYACTPTKGENNDLGLGEYESTPDGK